MLKLWNKALPVATAAVAVCFVGQTTAARAVTLPPAVAGFRLTTAPKTYGPSTLADHVDGAAQAVMRYHFKSCLYGIYAPGGKGSQVITADVYTMADTLDSFGYFSAQLSPGAAYVKHVSVGAGAFLLNTNVTFWRGPYVVSVTIAANQPTSNFHTAMLSIARAINSRLSGSSAEPSGLHMLPAGRVPYSEMFQRRDVGGERFLTNGFSARYAAAGQQATLFVCEYPSAGAASSAYHNYLSSSSKPFTLAPGAHPQLIHGLGSSAFMVKTRFTGSVIAALKGKFVVGMFKVANVAAARRLVTSTVTHLH